MSKSITTDRDYKLKLEENFLAHIGYEHVEALCYELDLVKDQWKDLNIPESMEQWFRDFQKREKKRIKRSNRSANQLKFAKRAAIFILFILIANQFLMAKVDAYRVHVLNAIIEVRQEFTKINYIFDDSDRATDLSEEWNGLYYPSYVPKKYKLLNSDFNGTVGFMEYENDENNVIIFQQFRTGASMQLDTENAKVTKILINDEEAILIEKGDLIMATWVQEDIAFHLQADNMKLSEFVKTAESIEIKK